MGPERARASPRTAPKHTNPRHHYSVWTRTLGHTTQHQRLFAHFPPALVELRNARFRPRTKATKSRRQYFLVQGTPICTSACWVPSARALRPAPHQSTPTPAIITLFGLGHWDTPLSTSVRSHILPARPLLLPKLRKTFRCRFLSGHFKVHNSDPRLYRLRTSLHQMSECYYDRYFCHTSRASSTILHHSRYLTENGYQCGD